MYPKIQEWKFLRLLILFILIAIALVACSGAVSTEPVTIQDNNLESDLNIPGPDPSEIIDSISEFPPVDRVEEPLEVDIPSVGKVGGTPAIIDLAEIVLLEESPSGYGLRITGTIPTPCHELKVDVEDPDDDDQIQVEVYSLSKPGEVCIQIIEEFDKIVPLEIFNPDRNQLWVIGEQVIRIEYHRSG